MTVSARSGLAKATNMKRVIFLAFLSVLLTSQAESASAPVSTETPDAGGLIRPTGEPTKIQAAPVPERWETVIPETPQAVVSVPEPPAAEAGSTAPLVAAADSAGISYGCVALSFAMLVLGFVAGAVWLRERNRKKLGGMYLRI